MTENMHISSTGKIKGGDYNEIHISGSGTIEGPVNFVSLHVSGACKAVNEAPLTGGKIRISGSVLANADITADTLKLSGALTSNGNIKTKELKVSGVLESPDGKIYADSVDISGAIENNNELNADKINIYGSAELNDLFGDTITINSSSRLEINIFNFSINRSVGPVHLSKVNNIECNTLTASSLSCKSISAENITLTDHCEIDLIQCDGTLSYSNTCKIGRIEGTCTQQIVED